MGELIGGLVEGLVSGIKGVIDRETLAKELEKLAGKVRREDIVSDAAIEQANKTLQRMRSVRSDYQDG
jgi:hypothetical protein